ncbi:hypothetical protein ACN27G_29510 [Plantactinospora sp. WMMB334]|uniref:hypothetical protein n=1 Tax=Plantactinospora sp. WMMB334 TaxID=3404119 RepID=UPI003B949D6E
MTDVPSPNPQTTFVGVAVAVTDRPGTDAVADRAAHDVSTHNHTGTYANTLTLDASGFVRIAGAGNRSLARAARASSSGATRGAASIHIGCDRAAPLPSPIMQTCTYQAPAPAPNGGGACDSTRS